MDEGVASIEAASGRCGSTNTSGCGVTGEEEVVRDKGSTKPKMPNTVDPVVSLLIIDDDPGSLDLFSNALEQPGLEILTASDPKDGLDIVCSRHPLMDLRRDP